MISTNPFSLDFLKQKPGKAARVLQALDSQQAALYLSTVPVRVLAPVIERIESWPAARILEHMPVDQSSSVLSHIKFPAAAAILRILDAAIRDSLLKHLPTPLTRTLSRSLSYPEDAVGAWVDSSAPHFSGNLSAADCLILLKKAGQSYDLVTVVDANHWIVGVVSISSLLVADSTRSLIELADRQCAPLAAQARLVMIKDAVDWQRYNTLPVRGNNGAFVGTLSRQTISHALNKDRPTQVVPLRDSLLAHMSRAMMVTVSGLLAMITSKRENMLVNQENQNDLNH